MMVDFFLVGFEGFFTLIGCAGRKNGIYTIRNDCVSRFIRKYVYSF